MTEKFKLTYATMYNPPAELHTKYEEAMAKTKANLGKEYAMIIDGKDVFAEEKFEDRTPINTEMVLAVMQKQPRDGRGNRGAIVNLASIASLAGIPGRNAYSAAKAGVVGMTRALASEWAREGIRVNAVAPGYVRTALVADLVQRGTVDGHAIASRTPMGRMAEPEEISEVITFLASPASSYVTGSVLSADGGWTAFGAPTSVLAEI